MTWKKQLLSEKGSSWGGTQLGVILSQHSWQRGNGGLGPKWGESGQHTPASDTTHILLFQTEGKERRETHSQLDAFMWGAVWWKMVYLCHVSIFQNIFTYIICTLPHSDLTTSRLRYIAPCWYGNQDGRDGESLMAIQLLRA